MRNQPTFPSTKKVSVTKSEVAELSMHLSNWRAFVKFTTKMVIDEVLLKKLIIVEHHTRQRGYMLRRLVGMLHTTQRKSLYNLLGIR